MQTCLVNMLENRPHKWMLWNEKTRKQGNPDEDKRIMIFSLIITDMINE